MRVTKKMFIPYGTDSELRQLVRSASTKSFRLMFPKYVHVLSRIIFYRTYCSESYKSGGVPINIKCLSKLIGERDSGTKQIIDNLVSWNFIFPFRDYFAGKFSRTYKLHDRFDNCRFCMLSFDESDGKFIRKLLGPVDNTDIILKHQLNVLYNYIQVSEKGLSFLRKKYDNPYLDAVIDAYSCDDNATISSELLSHVSVEPADMGLLSFILKDFYAYRPDPISRIYTNFCSLKREYRKFLLMNGKPLIGTDIVNSQLLFSIPVINSHFVRNSHKFDTVNTDDLLLYKDLAESGKLYESVAAFSDNYLEFNDRKTFKQRFYSSIFFSRPSQQRSKIKDSFQMLFPVVSDVLADIKRPDHAMFAVLCQQLEASVMIDVVLAALIEKGITALALHDSIYVCDGTELATVEQLIVKAMHDKFSIKVRFRVEAGEPATEVNVEEMMYGIAKRISPLNPDVKVKTWAKAKKRRMKQSVK